MKEKRRGLGQLLRGVQCCGAGWVSLVESIASRREMLVEILDYHGYVSGDSVS